MRVIIIGAGNTGRNLATKLCREKHHVVLVDAADAPLTEAQGELDVLAVTGHGSSPATLARAELTQCDLLVAVTDNDEVNILACLLAHHAGVRHKVARIANEEYFQPGAADPAALGIDLVINPHRECAADLAAMLRLPGTQEVVDLFDGAALAVGFTVPSDSPLYVAPLKLLPNREMLDRVRFIGARHGDEVFIPYGNTQFAIGDDVYIVGRREDIAPFLDWASPSRPVIRKVVIAGGRGLGLALARRLEAEGDLKVTLMEADAEQAERDSGLLERALVMRGDSLSNATLAEAGFDEQTAFVGALPVDESNIIACLLAQQRGACFTVAQIARPELVPIADNLSLLDRAVSPHLSMISAILHFMRGHNVTAASVLDTLPGELIETRLGPDHPWADRSIQEIKVPRGAIIAIVRRGDTFISANGSVRLQPEDRLALYALPGAVDRLKKLC